MLPRLIALIEELELDASIYDWVVEAACHRLGAVGPFDLLSPTFDDSVAKLTCSNCPVKEQCHNFAITIMDQEDDGELRGVLGGLTFAEREEIRGHPPDTDPGHLRIVK